MISLHKTSMRISKGKNLRELQTLFRRLSYFMRLSIPQKKKNRNGKLILTAKKVLKFVRIKFSKRYAKYSSSQKFELTHGVKGVFLPVYFTMAAVLACMEVMIPTPRTRPSRNNIRIPGRIYSGRFANSKRTLARLPGRNTIPPLSSSSYPAA